MEILVALSACLILVAPYILADNSHNSQHRVLTQKNALHSFLRSARANVFANDVKWSEETSDPLPYRSDSEYLTECKDENLSQKQQVADLITHGLPGQPPGFEFAQYSGFITVNASVGRYLFYYFVEATQDSSTKPLILWLNGGPGCSSVGNGAMAELGPFRPNPDGKTLKRNPYSWNTVANVLFLESPAGVGFSYSNNTKDYRNTGNKLTAEQSYAFLVNWFQRFPQYKSRDFYIAGESYAGFYIPELTQTILDHKKRSEASFINLKGIMIGNGDMSIRTDNLGQYIYTWSHALLSDQTYMLLTRYCPDISFIHRSGQRCIDYLNRLYFEGGPINIYNIYAPVCVNGSSNLDSQGEVEDPVYDPCIDEYVLTYMNNPQVQKAFHVTKVPREWAQCSDELFNNWKDYPRDLIPLYRELTSSGLRILLYSGDTDSLVPVTSTRMGIKAINISIKTPWYAWAKDINNTEVYGYTTIYKGLTFATVRGAGHEVPKDRPERALALVTNFLAGKALPRQSG